MMPFTSIGSWRTWLRRIIRIIGVVVGFFGLLFLLALISVFGHVPTPGELRTLRQEQATLVYSADNELIGKYFTRNRTNVRFEHIPPYVFEALIATEDVRFYDHRGVDFRAMLRVLGKSILLRDERSGGGSTITQQLAKNLLGRARFGPLTLFINKSKEVILAKRIERVYSKDEILTLYLNAVPFGGDVYGIESAAQRYFSKTASELSIHEGATLVAMLKANTYYNPVLNPERARQRRNVVFDLMAQNNVIRQSHADSLKQDTLSVRYSNMTEDNPSGYFLARVKLEAEELLRDITKKDGSQWDLQRDGLRIHTTLNSKLQQLALNARKNELKKLQTIFDRQWPALLKQDRRVAALLDQKVKASARYGSLSESGWSEEALDDSLRKPHPMILFGWAGHKRDSLTVRDSVAHYLKLLHAGVFAMDAHSGAVMSYVGGNSFDRLPYDLVMSKRQAASAFKPFVYAAALQAGVDPCEWIHNGTVTFPEYDNWSPRNYDGSTGGYYTMRGGLAASVNLITVQLHQRAGHEALQAHLNQLGVHRHITDRPAVALGTESFSLEEMVRAYAVYANGGKLVQPYMIARIEDSDGNVLYEHEATHGKRTITTELATQMQTLLKGVVDHGTASALKSTYKLRGEWAGKTGTAQNYGDAWFIGFNGNVVVGVWVGAQYPVVHFTSKIGSGASAALPIFARFVSSGQRAQRETFVAAFPENDNINIADCGFYRDENLFDKLNEGVLAKVKKFLQRRGAKRNRVMN